MRDDCGAVIRLVPESGWLEIEGYSVSSVTTTQVRPFSVGDVERSDGYDTPKSDKVCLARECGWFGIKKGHDKWTTDATGTVARYRQHCQDKW